MNNQTNKRRHSRFNNRGRNRFQNRRNKRKVKSFDPREVVLAANSNSRVEQTETYKVKHNFTDFKIDDRLKKNILGRGYNEPTPIQDQIIPEIIDGRDVVGIANTGTGKTAAFLIPLINKVLKTQNKSRSLIIAPTRELASQIEKELFLFTKDLGIYSVTCIGGVKIYPQIKRLSRNPQFVIGTPGRLLDLYEQKKLDIEKFDSVVLDEVDRMLDMGFINDIKKIIELLPKERQSLFFSATMDEKSKSIMQEFLNDPVVVSVKSNDSTASINQQLVEINGKDKADILQQILRHEDVEKSLIFVRTKRGADSLSKTLYSLGFNSTSMHGDKSQHQRQKSLGLFRTGKVDILIATDVASRGIDVSDITHVINFDLPETYEDYIHRIGRTGRGNKTGVALTFVG